MADNAITVELTSAEAVLFGHLINSWFDMAVWPEAPDLDLEQLLWNLLRKLEPATIPVDSPRYFAAIADATEELRQAVAAESESD